MGRSDDVIFLGYYKIKKEGKKLFLAIFERLRKLRKQWVLLAFACKWTKLSVKLTFCKEKKLSHFLQRLRAAVEALEGRVVDFKKLCIRAISSEPLSHYRYMD